MPDEAIHRGTHLHFYQRQRWEFVRRAKASAVVAIAAATPAGEMVLIEQLRVPLGAAGTPVIELPAGLVGDEQAEDDLLEAARRELIEETGFDASRLRVVGRGPSSAGLSDEVVDLVVAEGLTRVATGGGVGDEDITVHLVPLTEVGAWLAARHATGRLIDLKVWAGLWFLQATGT